MDDSTWMIFLKEGLFRGSLSQQTWINSRNWLGVFSGILGRRSLLSTSIDTCRPLMSRF